MTRLLHRWRTQLNAKRNVNCRTRESSNIWTQMALSVQPVSIPVWVSYLKVKFLDKFVVSAALLFIYLCCTGITADGCVLAEFLRNDCGITLKSLVKRNIGGNYIYNIIKKKSVRERVFFPWISRSLRLHVIFPVVFGAIRLANLFSRF